MKDWKRPYLRALCFSCNRLYLFLRDKKKLGSARFPQPAARARHDEASVRRRRSARVELLFLLTLPHTSGGRAYLICWCSSLPTSNVGLNSHHFPCQA
jgi:hypothetical protein